MFKTQAELKEFILWAKNEKVKSFKVDQVEIVISDLAFIDQLTSSLSQPEATKTQENQSDAAELPYDGMSKEEYEALLYHSSHS